MGTHLGDPFEEVFVNIYSKETKEIIFTGSQKKAARFLNVVPQVIGYSLRSKYCLRKKYFIRYAKVANPEINLN